MLNESINKKLKSAKYKKLKDGLCFAEIPGVKSVWVSGKTKKAVQKEFGEILEEWILLKVRNHERIPGLNLNFSRRLFSNA